MKKVIAIIQARMGSTRLPGKTLVEICGKPLLEHIVERVRYSRLIKEIVVATTTKQEDNVIIDLCTKMRVKSFRGSEDDVLDRFYQCVKRFEADIIVRITADDPFKDPEVIDKAIEAILDNDKLNYVSNTIRPTYPEGIDVEVFTFGTLEKAWKEAREPTEREHVTPYIWNNPDIFKVLNMENDVDLSYMRWTLDTKEDLEFTRAIYKRLYRPNEIFLMKDILEVLAREPELKEINSGVERFAGYKKSMLKDLQ